MKIACSKIGGYKETIYIQQLLLVQMQAKDTALNQHLMKRMVKKQAEERNYTPFDGKENDWVSFARQQAEFYRNAGQYITNLQIDIKEIDSEIENILLETEGC